MQRVYLKTPPVWLRWSARDGQETLPLLPPAHQSKPGPTAVLFRLSAGARNLATRAQSKAATPAGARSMANLIQRA
jgi:hypothetical protein